MQSLQLNPTDPSEGNSSNFAKAINSNLAIPGEAVGNAKVANWITTFALSVTIWLLILKNQVCTKS